MLTLRQMCTLWDIIERAQERRWTPKDKLRVAVPKANLKKQNEIANARTRDGCDLVGGRPSASKASNHHSNQSRNGHSHAIR